MVGGGPHPTTLDGSKDGEHLSPHQQSSRLDVSAIPTRQRQGGLWSGALWLALSHTDPRRKGERGQSYTIFADFASDIDRISDRIDPGHRLAVEAIEACSRFIRRGDSIMIRWVLTHLWLEGYGMADLYARGATDGDRLSAEDSFLSFFFPPFPPLFRRHGGKEIGEPHYNGGALHAIRAGASLTEDGKSRRKNSFRCRDQFESLHVAG